MYLNQQDKWVTPASPLVNAAQRNQQAWTVNNSCQYERFNSAFQPSSNAAMASQPYLQTHNFQLSATPYQVYSFPQRAGLTSNMCQPQVALPNNQFALTNSQSINQRFLSASEMHDRRSYGNMYTDWINPGAHCTTSTPLLLKQATFNQPLVPVTAKKQHSFYNQIQDIVQQDMTKFYYEPNAKMANLKSGKDDRNAISSPLGRQFVSCNVPQVQSRLPGSKLLRSLKQQTPVEIPSQTQSPATKNPGHQSLTQCLTSGKGNDCSSQASSAHLSMKAVAVVPPLSQESSKNISKRTSPSTTSECYKDQEKSISKPVAEVCNWKQECYDRYITLGSSQSDSSSTPQSEDSTTLSPVSQNIAEHQSSCQTETETALSSKSFKHDPPLVETHASNMSCPVEAQRKQENPTELLILKEGEEYSETPYKSSWLNLNEQLNDIDDEFGFPWAMRYRPHHGRTIEGSTAAECPNHVSQTQLDPDESIKQIEASLSELLSSPTALLSESESDESCYNFEIEVLPSELAKEIYEQSFREGTLEPKVCVDNGVSSGELKLHNGTESLIERVTVFSTSEIGSGLPLSNPIKIPYHLSVETDDHTMKSSFPDRDETDDSLMETNGETEDGDFSDRTENTSSKHSDSKEDCAHPLQLHGFDIQRKYENTYQGVKPLNIFVKNSNFFNVFQRNNKQITKRKYAHYQTKHKTSKQSIYVFHSKKQEKIKDKLKLKTSAADTPSTVEISVQVLQEGKPNDGQIEIIEDTVETAPTSREENGCNQISDVQKTPNLFLEEKSAGPLPVTGVETQMEVKMTTQNSNERDIQQAVLKDGIKPYQAFLDKIYDLSSQGECQTVGQQSNKSKDHDSRNVTDKHPSPVELVSSQQEEKDDIICEVNKVPEASNSKESSVYAIADPQILVSNPEEESEGSLQSDVLDTQTQSKITNQDSDNKGVKVEKVLVDKAYLSNIPGCHIIDEKRKRQSGEEEEAFPFAKKKYQRAKDLQSQKSNESVSKCESLVADPPSRLVKLSLYGRSQLGDPNANQTSLKLPKDLFIRLCPREKSFSEGVCTENYSVKEQVWEKWRESFVPTNAGFKGKARCPMKFLSGEKLKIKKSLSSQMHISRKQKHCLSLKQRWLLKLKEKERKNWCQTES